MRPLVGAMAMAIAIALATTNAKAQTVVFPLDAASPYRDITFVVRHSGFNWFSENATMDGAIGPIFDLLRGGGSGETVQVLFLEADCQHATTRSVAIGYGRTPQEVNASLVYNWGPFQTLDPTFPESIRARAACLHRMFLGN